MRHVKIEKTTRTHSQVSKPSNALHARWRVYQQTATPHLCPSAELQQED